MNHFYNYKFVIDLKISSMSFYQKFIQNGSKGYSLRGGPFAKWRYPANKVIYRKRLIAGPEPERPRSVWSNW